MALELLPEAGSGAGRCVAGSEEESEPIWLAFLFVSCRRVGAFAGPLALLETALFFLLTDKAFLSSRSRAGDCLAAEIAFKKARSSCFSISCKQENIHFQTHSLTDGELHSQQRTKLSRAPLLTPCWFTLLALGPTNQPNPTNQPKV